MVEWTWCHCWVPLQGAIVVCYGWVKGGHCWVPLQGAVDVVPLLVAFIGCHCSVLWLGGGWRPTLGEWTWCHCWVPFVVYDGWGRGWGPTLGEWTWWHCRCYGWGGDGQLWRSGRGAIAGCDCSVLWLGGRVTTNFGGVDVVPLAEWTWCHCRVPLQCALVGGRVTTNFGGVDVVPLMGAVVVCYGGGGWRPTLGEWTWCLW